MEHNLWSNYFDTLVPGGGGGGVGGGGEGEGGGGRGWEG